MKIAIIGYGRMGKEIEEMARQRGHEIVAITDNETDWKVRIDDLKSAEVAIEFSMPETAPANIIRCFELGIPVVSGTTGWSDELDRIRETCINGGHSFFYASNFSPGMNIMFALNKKLAGLIARQDGYQILIEEIHHAGKKDSPSGTAITLANDIIGINPEKKRWVNHPANGNEDLEIISIRRNQVPGTHFVRYDSDIDSLEIRHTAHSRKGFALGALLAAEWLPGRKGVFGMHDLISH
ncbi:MAG TPA: dihydrodipicolinate reductase C-terminal domain-containing protein [Bacteroidales bacterium]|nr:dihydrodipicolinate reductase C-terminal domain-containing protein [Bacteroidales bacterium]